MVVEQSCVRVSSTHTHSSALVLSSLLPDVGGGDGAGELSLSGVGRLLQQLFGGHSRVDELHGRITPAVDQRNGRSAACFDRHHTSLYIYIYIHAYMYSCMHGDIQYPMSDHPSDQLWGI